jgi:sugar/nucleoside kinase (ribokinase family)
LAKFLIAVAEGRDDHFGDFATAEACRAGVATVQQSIHGYERPAGMGQVIGGKHSMRRKTILQAEGNKQRLADSIPVR